MAISCVSAADCEDKIRSIKEERREIVNGYRITATVALTCLPLPPSRPNSLLSLESYGEAYWHTI